MDKIQVLSPKISGIPETMGLQDPFVYVVFWAPILGVPKIGAPELQCCWQSGCVFNKIPEVFRGGFTFAPNDQEC